MDPASSPSTTSWVVLAAMVASLLGVVTALLVHPSATPAVADTTTVAVPPPPEPELEPAPEPAPEPALELELLPTVPAAPAPTPEPIREDGPDASLEAFAEVREWCVWHPLELIEAERRLRDVIARYPDSAGAAAAESFLAGALAKGEARAASLLEELDAQAEALIAGGAFASAAELYAAGDDFPAAMRGPFEEGARRVDRRCREALDAELARYDDDAERLLVLQERRDGATPGTRAHIERLAAELETKVVVAGETEAFRTLREDVINLMVRGAFAAAAEACAATPEGSTRSLNRKLRNLTASVTAVAAEAEAVRAALEEHLDSRLQLELRDGRKVSGKLLAVHADLSLEIKGEPFPVPLDELSDGAHDALLPAPTSREAWSARAGLYAACALEHQLERLQENPLAQRNLGVSLGLLLLHATNEHARLAYESLVQRSVPGNLVALAPEARRFVERHGQALWTWKSRREVQEGLALILVAARIAEGPAGLLHGDVELDEDGRVLIVYEFETAGELEDFSVALPSTVERGRGSVLLNGAARHAARFTGPLEIALRFAIDWDGELPLDLDRPDVRRDQLGSVLLDVYNGGERSAHIWLWHRQELVADLDGDGESDELPRPCHSLTHRSALIDSYVAIERISPPYQHKPMELVCKTDERSLELSLQGKRIFSSPVELPATAGQVVLAAINGWRINVESLVLRGRIDPEWIRERVAGDIERELAESFRRRR